MASSKINRSISSVVQSSANDSNTAVYLRQMSLGSQLTKRTLKSSQQLNDIDWNTSLPNELDQKKKEMDLIASSNINLSEESTESFSLLDQNTCQNDLETQSISAYDNMVQQKRLKTATVATAETIQFWDIGGYKILLDRCDNGLKLTADLKTMIEKRAKLEKDYASSLKKWCDNWNKYLNECQEYGDNLKTGWRELIINSSKTADIHTEIAKNLSIYSYSPVKMLENFKRENYQHRILNLCSLKKTNEFRIDFEKSQKHWSELHAELKKIQKEINKKPTIFKTATLNIKQNISKEKENRCKIRMKEIELEIKEYEKIYMRKINNIFEKTQQFEEERMKKFIQVFKKYHDVLKINGDERFEKVFRDLDKSISNINIKSDLKKWSQYLEKKTSYDST